MDPQRRRRGAAKAPGRKHLAGGAGAGRGLQNRFDAADQRDRGPYARGCTLGRENDHRIAFMQISQ